MEICSTMKGDRQIRGTVPVDVCLFYSLENRTRCLFSINKIKNRLENRNVCLYNENRKIYGICDIAVQGATVYL